MRVHETFHSCPRVETETLNYCCKTLQEEMNKPYSVRIGDFEKVDGVFKLVPTVVDVYSGFASIGRGYPFSYCPYCGDKFT